MAVAASTATPENSRRISRCNSWLTVPSLTISEETSSKSCSSRDFMSVRRAFRRQHQEQGRQLLYFGQLGELGRDFEFGFKGGFHIHFKRARACSKLPANDQD